MWPEQLLDVALDTAGWVVPRWLTTRDHLWVEHALDEATALVGRPRDEICARLNRPPGLGERPRAWRALLRLLLGLHGFAVRACRAPSALRAALFARAAAAAAATSRAAVVAATAIELGVTADELGRDLYADLPGERLLGPLAARLAPQELVERYNLALAQSLLLRAEALRARVPGSVRPVIRYARLQRLLCRVTRDPLAAGGAVVHLSGPLALFHHTTKYGHAMAAWLPALARAPRWELEASVRLRGESRRFRASWRDPIAATHVVSRRFDSAVEERFFRDLRRAAPDWQVLREADPVQLGPHILCPDFTLLDEARGLRLPVEIVGFWTPDYLDAKLAVLARLPPGVSWIVCLDETLVADAAGATPIATAGMVFRYRRRIDVPAFLAALEVWIRAGPAARAHGATPDR